ncbi:SDR family NAD(P)-dependent oxidoreductase [Frankia sp. CNm7]|uniref:SDR family NAD(P)-dependent oxidoreductase n=1 Tax=Frankia nepalensis TaxID=1836974 RepID=A0A937UU29_9ACTN|nr:SDR family NAD(P)-dependent oxidoreductase [Frankia nepalensis]MBL7495312.1 SDR family NAD(P)-dependent oxidoreductase [Frankia nepalensis]MBL7509691.1 SDR family NAD(P)-dependent oxidoreductase [Frankia nepalensis]MBL7517626.1 SDR family NAD(P)-dependent oxidoreductase [Frankia nepalensis]MBL7631845.1 SDR family NAD(P)-dependent oxidoreductase [Frankia nepalensis]
MRDFVGKVAVVTGAGQGIGRALVECFCAEGMKAVVADVVPELVEKTTAELRAAGCEVTGVVTDVTSLESVEALRDAALAAYGGVHVLCNNAGIGSGSEGHIWEHHVNDWRWSFDVNVLGVVNGLHAFTQTMIDQGVEGHIVNTTSGNGGFTPLINSAVYAATKAAVTTITECLWGQLKEAGVPVGASLLYPSTISPGLLDTGIWRPGANRPDRYDRPGAPPREGRDSLGAFRRRMEEAGLPVTFAPLSEVADLCLEGIRNDTFWITVPSEAQSAKILARAQSQVERADPGYLLETNLMTGRPAGANAKA